MSLDAHDGSAWRSITDLSVYDGSAWQPVRKLSAYDGTAWREVFDGEPVIASCGISSGPGSEIDITWSTGDNCESVTVELFDASDDSLVDSSNHDTAPNTSLYSTTFSSLPAGTYYGRVRPFSLDGQSGVAGTGCLTGNATV